MLPCWTLQDIKVLEKHLPGENKSLSGHNEVLNTELKKKKDNRSSVANQPVCFFSHFNTRLILMSSVKLMQQVASSQVQ